MPVRSSIVLFATSLLVTSLPAEEFKADVCIYGGTSAGVVAAVQVAKMGRSVLLVEPGRHVGGMSVEGLGGTDIDNHTPFQNSPAVGGLALEFYRRISVSYGRQQAFEEMLRTRAKNTSLWRFECHVAEAVFEAMLAESGVRVLREHALLESGGVEKTGARITRLALAGGNHVAARCFMDATYEGDLLAAAGISTAIGREGNARYGETKNGIRGDTTHGQFDRKISPWKTPGDPTSGLIEGVQGSAPGEPGMPDDSIQGYCFRLCLTRDAANQIPIEKPAGYDPARYELQRRYLLAGGVIQAPGPSVPNGKTDPGSWHHLASNFTGRYHDYPAAGASERARMREEARQYIQGLYWFMAHDPAVPEKLRAAWAAWGLCKDEFPDNDGWPRAFYVRNGRRMVSDFVLTEAHVRLHEPAPVEDSVGLIWWPPDLHHARRIVRDGAVWNEGAVFDKSRTPDWRPCGIPYRCLVPKAAECVNLLTPTCPSSSYVGYGAYRIEFTFMVAAQSAATAAVMALDKDIAVQQVPYAELRDRLVKDGQILAPPEP